MNHRGSGVTEDFPAKYARERQKFFGLAERRLPPCRRARSRAPGLISSAKWMPIAEIGGLEKF